jgi:hypothetical protein
MDLLVAVRWRLALMDLQRAPRRIHGPASELPLGLWRGSLS